jgi:exodeoxyribonuclease VII large subunit
MRWPSSTGYLYFTLKDAGAVISGVMFRNSLRYLAFEPRDGMLVRAVGRISVYAQRGTYQIVAEELEQAGTGDILERRAAGIIENRDEPYYTTA